MKMTSLLFLLAACGDKDEDTATEEDAVEETAVEEESSDTAVAEDPAEAGTEEE